MYLPTVIRVHACRSPLAQSIVRGRCGERTESDDGLDEF